MSDILEKLDKAISEVAELGLDCEIELWQVHEEIERLSAEGRKHEERHLMAQKCINEIDDFMEYRCLSRSVSEIQAAIHRILAKYNGGIRVSMVEHRVCQRGPYLC